MHSSSEYLLSKIQNVPQVAFVLGSGLNDVSEMMEDVTIISYNDIPGFVQSTVAGHAGQMIFGTIAGKSCVMLCGRFHHYEGYNAQEITQPVRTLKEIGVSKLILTNAAGGVNKSFHPGDLMVITDHINFANVNPCIGPNDDAWGPRFFDMSDAYAKVLRDVIHTAARESGIPMKDGVYVMATGPNYETPAEIRAFRILGGDAVGMSTVPTVIEANHIGMQVAGISCITNMAAGVLDQPINHEEVMEIGASVNGRMKKLVQKIVELN